MAKQEGKIWKIGVTGGTGLIGSALVAFLAKAGHQPVVISRSGAEGTIQWNPDKGEFDATPLEGFDAVVHLAGEPIAQRWTGEVRERIYSSRVGSTRLLVKKLAELKAPPQVFLSASGINYYPSTTMGARLDESAKEGSDFLSRVCQHWEGEACKAERFATRVCMLRTAVVLSPDGGALAKLLPVFKAGIGGRVGSGEQPFPWISLQDYVGACSHLLFDSTHSGPANLVAPECVSNQVFTKTLGSALNRPAILPVPKIAIRLAFGEMGTSTLLHGVDARPGVLENESYPFHHPKLKVALAEMFQKN